MSQTPTPLPQFALPAHHTATPIFPTTATTVHDLPAARPAPSSASVAPFLPGVLPASPPPVPPVQGRDTSTINVVPSQLNIPFLLSPELRNSVPQPRFSGDRSQWPDFEREFDVWFRFQNLNEEYRVWALVSCLSPRDQELYRKRISQNGQTFDNIIADLRQRFAVQNEFSARTKWYDCKCIGEDSGSFLAWFTEWTLLKERLEGVSPAEEKK